MFNLEDLFGFVVWLLVKVTFLWCKISVKYLFLNLKFDLKF